MKKPSHMCTGSHSQPCSELCWKWCKCPSTGEWINTLYVLIMKYLQWGLPGASLARAHYVLPFQLYLEWLYHFIVAWNQSWWTDLHHKNGQRVPIMASFLWRANCWTITSIPMIVLQEEWHTTVVGINVDQSWYYEEKKNKVTGKCAQYHSIYLKFQDWQK